MTYFLGRKTGTGPAQKITVGALVNQAIASAKLYTQRGQTKPYLAGIWKGNYKIAASTSPTVEDIDGMHIQCTGAGVTLTLPTPSAQYFVKCGILVTASSDLTLSYSANLAGPAGGATTLGPLVAGTTGELLWDGAQWIVTHLLGPIPTSGGVAPSGGGDGGVPGGGSEGGGGGNG